MNFIEDIQWRFLVAFTSWSEWSESSVKFLYPAWPVTGYVALSKSLKAITFITGPPPWYSAEGLVQKHKSNLKTQASYRATIQTQALWCLQCYCLPSKTLSRPLLCPVSLGLLSCYPHIAQYKAHSVFCVNSLVAGVWDPQKQSIFQCFSLAITTDLSSRCLCKCLINECSMSNSLPGFFVVGLCFIHLCFVL